MTISRVQGASGVYTATSGPPTRVVATWPQATTPGNLLIAVIGVSLVSGGSSTFNLPAGWSEIDRIDNASNIALIIYTIENAPSRSGQEVFTITGVARDTALHITEYSSTNPLTMVTVGTGNTGTGTTASTDALAPPQNASILRIAGIVNRNNSTQSNPANGFTEVAEAMSTNATVGNRVNCAYYHQIHTSAASLACSVSINASRPWTALGAIFAETNPAASFGKVIVGGAKKDVVNRSIIIGGQKKAIANMWVISGGQKKSLV